MSQLFRQADLRMKSFKSVFPFNRDEEGNIMLGSDTLVNGTSKAAIKGQIINNNVDAANNPQYSYLNTGLQTAPIIMGMLNMGTNEELVFKFMNTPVIRRYANDKKLIDSAKIFNLTRVKKEKGKEILEKLNAYTEIKDEIARELDRYGFNKLKTKNGSTFSGSYIYSTIEDKVTGETRRKYPIEYFLKELLGYEFPEIITEDILNGFPVWQFLKVSDWTRQRLENTYATEQTKQWEELCKKYRCYTCKYYESCDTDIGLLEKCNYKKENSNSRRDFSSWKTRREAFSPKKSCVNYERK